MTRTRAADAICKLELNVSTSSRHLVTLGASHDLFLQRTHAQQLGIVVVRTSLLTTGPQFSQPVLDRTAHAVSFHFMPREQKTVTKHDTIALRSDGTLKLGVVADTHSLPNERGLELLAAEHPDFILHGGDIGDLSVLDRLRAIAPVYAVRGNIDARVGDLPDVLSLTLTESNRVILRVLLTHIALAGPRIRADARRWVKAERASLLVCGHSHVPFLGVDSGITAFNPGSIGPRRFRLPILFGIISVSPTNVTMHHISCETGRRWEPGSAA